MTKITLTGLGKLTKPADTLIKKISSAVYLGYEPFHMVRMAKAESKAGRIKATTQIEIDELQKRAALRWYKEEGQRQQNIEDITAMAIPHLKESARPEDIEDDWVTNIFDKCRIISDEKMQELWARILAGEANIPGTFSRRTVNHLADIDKADVELFTTLCRFVWQIDGRSEPLIFDTSDDFYIKRGLTFDNLSHLDSIGLIQFQNTIGLALIGPANPSIAIYDQAYYLTLSPLARDKIETGKVFFTNIGREFYRICPMSKIREFPVYVETQWLKHHATLQKI